MLTREQADEILAYVAQEIISPLAFDDRPADEIWYTGRGLCAFG